MKAIIRMPNGDVAYATYFQREHVWSIDRGLDNVPVPAGVSAIVALQNIHNSARMDDPDALTTSARKAILATGKF